MYTDYGPSIYLSSYVVSLLSLDKSMPKNMVEMLIINGITILIRLFVGNY